MSKKSITLSVLLAASLLLGACGNKQTEVLEQTSNFQIGLVTAGSSIDDGSFNEGAWRGINTLAEQHGLVENENFRYLDSEDEGAIVRNQVAFAEAGFDLTVATGFLQMAALVEVAPQFPDSNFVIIDSVVDVDNVTSVTFKEHEGSFLAGVVAAMTSETGKIGFVGGMESEVIERFEAGFIQGAKSINPDIEIISGYTGSFSDAALGVTVASAMYGQGVDVIFPAAGGSGYGVFTEAQNRSRQGENVWVIGADSDQHHLGMPEDVVLTSMIKHVDGAIIAVAEDIIAGNTTGGHLAMGLAEDGVDITTTGGHLSERILEAVERARASIVDGDVVVSPTIAGIK